MYASIPKSRTIQNLKHFWLQTYWEKVSTSSSWTGFEVWLSLIKKAQKLSAGKEEA